MPPKGIWQAILGNQMLRFVLSAGIGFIVDISTFNILYYLVFKNNTQAVMGFRINYGVSFCISYVLGVVVNFLITRYLVFSESKLPPAQQFIRFLSVACIGFFANLFILKIMVMYLHFPPPVARPAAALSLFLASFFIHKLFSFNLTLRHHARNNNTKGN
ncbi:GtrA family protein [Mucilaginibacter ginkgonis]|uniref:GtrA family protein n=1 Tax=Mucilaginibacter ginkgonis TaxID=2682091 RepID=A0A6I4IN92_9SPHI|nr:GtrA family protein [Mucilaginibacter ginkgonis]QQL51389.1 GtrA family protein [Mucilaginibacter ginkgonis]